MSLSASDLQDLQSAVADRLYVQISGWHLYLGDADLASAPVSYTHLTLPTSHLV